MQNEKYRVVTGPEAYFTPAAARMGIVLPEPGEAPERPGVIGAGRGSASGPRPGAMTYAHADPALDVFLLPQEATDAAIHDRGNTSGQRDQSTIRPTSQDACRARSCPE